MAPALWGGCGGDPVDLPVATTIEVSPATAVLEDVGLRVQLDATVKDQDGQLMTAVEVDWSSSDNTVAAVSGDGLVTGRNTGTATVTASVDALAASATITVESGPRLVLRTIYREMGGEDWNNNSNWLTDKPLDSWYGVYTSGGDVVRLQLIRNGLTGTIPPELGSLAALEFLSLSENGLTGSIPPELGNLRSLTTLSIGGNRLTGSIPPELGRLNNLKGLYLPGNELSGSIPPELGDLSIVFDLDLPETGSRARSRLNSGIWRAYSTSTFPETHFRARFRPNSGGWGVGIRSGRGTSIFPRTN